MVNALVIAFPDVEDIELTTTVDVLRRGGVEVNFQARDSYDYEEHSYLTTLGHCCQLIE